MKMRFFSWALKKIFVVLGLWLMVLPIAVSGCEDDKNYSCTETVETMYGGNCKLWCDCDGNGCDPYSCEWHNDDDPAYLTKDDADGICADMRRKADDKDCHGELGDLLNCFTDQQEDNCGMDCENEAEDFWHCASKFLYF